MEFEFRPIYVDLDILCLREEHIDGEIKGRSRGLHGACEEGSYSYLDIGALDGQNNVQAVLSYLE